MWPSLVLATLAVVSQAHLCLFIHAFLTAAFVFREYVHGIGFMVVLNKGTDSSQNLTLKQDGYLPLPCSMGLPEASLSPRLLHSWHSFHHPLLSTRSSPEICA